MFAVFDFSSAYLYSSTTFLILKVKFWAHVKMDKNFATHKRFSLRFARGGRRRNNKRKDFLNYWNLFCYRLFLMFQYYSFILLIAIVFLILSGFLFISYIFFCWSSMWGNIFNFRHSLWSLGFYIWLSVYC